MACGIFYSFRNGCPTAPRVDRRITKRWQRNSELIERRATEYARSKGYSFVTCGHTHLPLVSEIDGVRYLNSGTWIEPPPCPFVAVKGSDVRLEWWPLPGVEAPPEIESLRELPSPPVLRLIASRQKGCGNRQAAYY